MKNRQLYIIFAFLFLFIICNFFIIKAPLIGLSRVLFYPFFTTSEQLTNWSYLFNFQYDLSNGLFTEFVFSLFRSSFLIKIFSIILHVFSVFIIWKIAQELKFKNVSVWSAVLLLINPLSIFVIASPEHFNMLLSFVLFLVATFYFVRFLMIDRIMPLFFSFLVLSLASKVGLYTFLTPLIYLFICVANSQFRNFGRFIRLIPFFLISVNQYISIPPLDNPAVINETLTSENYFPESKEKLHFTEKRLLTTLESQFIEYFKTNKDAASKVRFNSVFFLKEIQKIELFEFLDGPWSALSKWNKHLYLFTHVLIQIIYPLSIFIFLLITYWQMQKNIIASKIQLYTLVFILAGSWPVLISQILYNESNLITLIEKLETKVGLFELNSEYYPLHKSMALCANYKFDQAISLLAKTHITRISGSKYSYLRDILSQQLKEYFENSYLAKNPVIKVH